METGRDQQAGHAGRTRRLAEELVRSAHAMPAGWARYTAAVALVAVAWSATAIGTRSLPAPTYLLFAGAVAVSAWYGGVGPGLLTSALSLLAIDFGFLPPIGRLELNHAEELVDTAIFVVVALTISATTDAMRRARRDAQLRAGELAHANAALQDRIHEVQLLSQGLHESNTLLSITRAEAERAAARATGLFAVTAALSEAGSVEDVTHVVLDRGLALVEAGRGYLARVDGARVEILGHRGYPEGLAPRRGALSTADPIAGAVFEVIRTRTPVWLASPEEYAARYPLTFAQLGTVSETQSTAVVPLVVGDDVVGVLVMSFMDAAALGLADRAYTLLLAQSTADALRRARSYDVERERRRAAEVQARVREEVLQMVAHDLRNPLNAIVSGAEILDDTSIDPADRREVLDILRRGTEQMTRLISDLLDTVRLQTGHLALDAVPVPLGRLVRHVESMFRRVADARGIRLRVRLSDEHYRVRADETRMHQVLGNLLANALKFTDAGGEVTLEARAADGHAIFRVRDSGPGIPAERIPRLFEQFWQGRPGDRRGLGLGLAIAKGIVDAHGGHIWAESIPGRGSVFSVSVPAARSDTGERAAGPR